MPYFLFAAWLKNILLLSQAVAPRSGQVAFPFCREGPWGQIQCWEPRNQPSFSHFLSLTFFAWNWIRWVSYIGSSEPLWPLTGSFQSPPFLPFCIFFFFKFRKALVCCLHQFEWICKWNFSMSFQHVTDRPNTGCPWAALLYLLSSFSLPKAQCMCLAWSVLCKQLPGKQRCCLSGCDNLPTPPSFTVRNCKSVAPCDSFSVRTRRENKPRQDRHRSCSDLLPQAVLGQWEKVS